MLEIQPYVFEIKYIPGKEVVLADAISRVNPQDKMELKGLDFTVHELTPCMAPIQMSMICAEQKKDAKIQLLMQEFALRVAQVLQRDVPSPQGVGPWDMISALKTAALHIWVGCLFDLA